ncbi:MAG: PIN domain-containing protein [Gemmataceae bacterium]|nr:PIN domain-containing protein [Gemmataceae bacterium]
MIKSFLDSVGLIAVWDDRDQWHAEATDAFDRLLVGGGRLFSTEPVFFECGNMAARRPFRKAVSDLRRDLQRAGTLIVPTPDEVDAAWAAYDRGEAGGTGIVDQISFAVMRRLGIARAFTNDRHFAAAGFEPLF